MNVPRLSLLGLVFLTACSSPAIEGVKTFSYLSGTHAQGLLTYKEAPAVGGPHKPGWQNCAVYTAPLYQMYVVHSLEHGAVSITYRPGLPDAQLNTLTDLARGHTYTLLSPYQQTSPIILTAWGAQLSVDAASDPRVLAFVKQYEQSKSAPEPGAPCSGGVSSTS